MNQALKAGALGQLRGMGWGGRWEGVQNGGTHVRPWLIHVDVRQKPPQYCKVISHQLKLINFLKFIYLFICLVTLGLLCCTWAFSSCREQGLFSNYGVWNSPCGGFSGCTAQVLGHKGSVAGAPRV